MKYLRLAKVFRFVKIQSCIFNLIKMSENEKKAGNSDVPENWFDRLKKLEVRAALGNGFTEPKHVQIEEITQGSDKDELGRPTFQRNPNPNHRKLGEHEQDAL